METYRGWTIQSDYYGFSGLAPYHDAWIGDGEWVEVGHVWGNTVQDVRDAIDDEED